MPFRSDGNKSYTNAWQPRQKYHTIKKEKRYHTKERRGENYDAECIRKTREPPRTNTAKRETNPFHSQAQRYGERVGRGPPQSSDPRPGQKCYVHRLHRRWNRSRKAINYTRDDSHDS